MREVKERKPRNEVDIKDIYIVDDPELAKFLKEKKFRLFHDEESDGKHYYIFVMKKGFKEAIYEYYTKVNPVDSQNEN